MENASPKDYTKKDLVKMVEKASNQGITEIKREMIAMKESIVKKTKKYINTEEVQI